MTWIKLNVGGKMFETQLSTLTAYPTSTLAKMFKSDLMHNNPVHDGVYCLDSDPQCFQHILSWLRYGTVSIPNTLDKKMVMMTAKHLGLDDMAKQLEKECSGKGAMTDWMKLNVGGTIFETSRATLTSHPTSSLARMFEPNSNLPPATITQDGVYQIDACPLSFAVILNWLRYRHLMLGQVRAEDVMPVADYFGLEKLQALLTKHIQKEAEANSKVLTCMEDGVDRLEDVLQQLQCELGGMQDKMDDMKIEVAGVATGLEDLWRIKCEVANIASIMK
eukprot:GFUD01023002.1.p1 GENE.GFUD01023002.1~~GFUD01023002.1.p1  ORF type:complete len:277 (-),score=86.46 GFUD01023002.1:102-932(-)